MSLKSIVYRGKELKIVNQLLLPGELQYVEIKSTEDAFNVIQQMQIIGTSAIAILACLSIAVESQDLDALIDREKLRRQNKLDYLHYLKAQADYLCSARPMVVSVRTQFDKLIGFYDSLIDRTEIDLKQSVDWLTAEIVQLLENDINLNKSIGKHGAEAIIKYWSIKDASVQKFKVLTINNTGDFSTAGYGTAMGIIRRLHELNKIDCCYFTESRPYNQGSRLTSYELCNEKINSELICDNMVASLMQKEQVHAALVAADRLAMSGDFVGKIGTYQLALLSKHFNVPFYVAFQLSTIDRTLLNGSQIPIEERPAHEMKFFGSVRLAPDEIKVWNPMSDLTPNGLWTEMVTEIGTFKKPADIEELNIHG